MVIELGDTSHMLPVREDRGNFLNSLLDRVGIKIVHIKTSYKYSKGEILNLLKMP